MMDTRAKHLTLNAKLAELAAEYQTLLSELSSGTYYNGKREVMLTANTLIQIVKRQDLASRKIRLQGPAPDLFKAEPEYNPAPESIERIDVNDHPADTPKPRKPRAKRDKVLASTTDWKDSDED